MPSNTKEYYKSWYTKNKAKHIANVTRKVECTCGLQVNLCNLKKHCGTQKHLNLIMKIENLNVRLNDVTEQEKIYKRLEIAELQLQNLMNK